MLGLKCDARLRTIDRSALAVRACNIVACIDLDARLIRDLRHHDPAHIPDQDRRFAHPAAPDHKIVVVAAC